MRLCQVLDRWTAIKHSVNRHRTAMTDTPMQPLATDDSGAVLKKISWEPLHEIAYRELRRAIMSARYAPGETLTVRATASALGVSPMPVRAAFSRLIAERAVEALGNGTVI